MNVAPDLVFQTANTLALLAWLALALSPARAPWAGTVWWLAGRVLPLLFAALYGWMWWAAAPTGGGFDSIAAVQRLFTSPHALTAGWLHYLAFDLFVGHWVLHKGAALQLPHGLLLPVLALTFLFGPLGLLAFLGLCAWRRPSALVWRGAPSTSSSTPGAL